MDQHAPKSNTFPLKFANFSSRLDDAQILSVAVWRGSDTDGRGPDHMSNNPVL